jgi:hypothetical protein
MSVTNDSTMSRILESFAEKYFNSAEQGGNTLVIFTLIGLFALWVGLSEYNRSRQEKRQDAKEKADREYRTEQKKAEDERADRLRVDQKAEQDRIREEEKTGKVAFGNEVKGLIGNLGTKLDRIDDTVRAELHGLDKRVMIAESSTKANQERIYKIELRLDKDQ